MPVGHYERVLYGIIAILAVIMFATLSIVTYAVNAEAYAFFLTSLVLLLAMGIFVLAFNVVKTIVSRGEPEETAEQTDDETLA
jgi:uncharacterized membrane protein